MNLFSMDLDYFQTAGFTLGLRANESAHSPLRAESPVPIAFWVSWMLSPIGFQSQILWGSVSPVQFPRVEVPDTGHKLLAPQEEDPSFDCVSPHQG